MKNAKNVFAILGAALLVVVAACGALGLVYQTTANNSTDYYSRIDNSLVKEITPHGGMNYRYHLQVYTETGERSEMDFDTSRVLKDQAFIRIESAPLRGVLGWEELQFDELPEAVQKMYQ